jgi:hypothetical protein
MKKQIARTVSEKAAELMTDEMNAVTGGSGLGQFADMLPPEPGFDIGGLDPSTFAPGCPKCGFIFTGLDDIGPSIPKMPGGIGPWTKPGLPKLGGF